VPLQKVKRVLDTSNGHPIKRYVPHQPAEDSDVEIIDLPPPAKRQKTNRLPTLTPSVVDSGEDEVSLDLSGNERESEWLSAGSPTTADRLFTESLDSEDDGLEEDLDQGLAELAGIDMEVVLEDYYSDCESLIPASHSRTNCYTESHSIHAAVAQVDSLYGVDLLLCKHSIEFAKCVKCKGKAKASPQWILDSGASLHFTGDMNDFIEFSPLKEPISVNTANGTVQVEGSGTVLINCSKQKGSVVRLSPVYYLPSATSRLLSMGEFMRNGYSVDANKHRIILKDKSDATYMVFYPRRPGDTIFAVSPLDVDTALEADTSKSKVDYKTMHRRLAHPSRTVLEKATKHTLQFPTIDFPKKDSIC
jgi:hypothetical protein